MSVSVVLSQACYYSPIGNSRDQVVHSLKEGISGIRSLADLFEKETNPVLFTGAITYPGPHDLDTRPLHPRLSPRYTRVLNGFVQNLRQVVADSGPIDKVFLVCKRPFYSKWADADSFHEYDFVERFLQKIELDIDPKEVYCLQAACSSGILSLNFAIRDLLRGSSGRILLIGLQTELNPEKFVSFKKLGALSAQPDPRRACQPFSLGRSGLVPGEVAVAMLLESRDSDQLQSNEIVLKPGFSNSDAARLTDCLEDGQYLSQCLSKTLQSFDLDQLDFVCPHGTSTPLNDRVEGQTLDRFFQSHRQPIRLVPLKQYLGHTLVSSGLWETVLTAELLRHNFLPPNLNVDEMESYQNLQFTPDYLPLNLSQALKISIGFGGINAALLVEKVS